MNQSVEISDFSNLFASLQGKIARSKISTAAKTQGDSEGLSGFDSLLKGIASGKNNKNRAGLSLSANNTGKDQSIDISGKKIIESLKEALIGKGINNFETAGLDMEGLSKLENLLLKSGADPDKVSSLISSLKAKMSSGKVSLKEVFAGLNNLEDDDFFKDEFFLEVSATPYLQSLLTSMGIDSETVRNMLENATDSEKGLNIGKLVKELKNFDKSMFKGASLFAGENNGVESATDVLEQIGLNLEKNDKNGKMSLGRLMAILEKNASPSATISNSAIKDSFSRVMDSIKTGLDQTDPTGSSRAMLAKIKLAEDKSAEKAEADQKSKNDRSTISKGLKTGNPNNSKAAQNETGSESLKAEASPENIFHARQKSGQNQKSEKAEDSLESSARMFEMIMGGEKNISETVVAEQNQKPLPVYVANQAAKGIMKAMNANEKEIIIQIKPPELGRMQIKIENTEAGIKVQIVAEKNSASELLNSNKSDLSAMLAESGIKVNKLDIQLAFNFDQAMSSMKEHNHQESGKRRNRRDGEGQTDDLGNESGQVDEIDSDDRLSLTA